MFRRRVLLAVACAAALLVAAPRAAPDDTAPAASRVVAFGDVHGNADGFAAILRAAGLIDDTRRWSGGPAVMVQTGDYLDRGLQIPEVMDLLMALEAQAASAGGRAVTLVGNHEGMNMIGDLRDVAPEVYARFADDQSEARRQRAFEAHVKLASGVRARFQRAGLVVDMPEIYREPVRETWMAAHPPGFIEYLEAFGPEGRYGRWLRKRDALVRVGDTVFLHGGLSPNESPKKLEGVNEQVRRDLARWDRVRKHLLDQRLALPHFTFAEVVAAGRLEIDRLVAEARAEQPAEPLAAPAALQASPLSELTTLASWSLVNPNGPLWFRGFATWTSEEGAVQLDMLQRRYGALRFVVGHTMPKSMRITPRFRSRVFLIDTGMLTSYYKEGRPSALEIDRGRYTAIYLDERMVVYDSSASAASQEG